MRAKQDLQKKSFFHVIIGEIENQFKYKND